MNRRISNRDWSMVIASRMIKLDTSSGPILVSACRVYVSLTRGSPDTCAAFLMLANDGIHSDEHGWNLRRLQEIIDGLEKSQ